MKRLPFRAAATCIALGFAVTLASAATGPFALLHSLFDPGTNAQMSARQGTTVAVNATLVASGVPLDGTAGQLAGAVKVYDASTGELRYTLTNPAPSRFRIFGESLALSDTRLVSAAPEDTLASGTGGCVWIYDPYGLHPTSPVLTLTNPSPAYADYFGIAVAVDGSRVVVGAYLDDNGANNTGRAYVYDLDGVNPTVPVVTLNSATSGVDDRFGTSVAISGTRVIVGAPRSDLGATNAGSAHVYDLVGATPAQPILTLTNPLASADDSFGSAVAISGARIVVGASGEDMGATNSGAAYVYELNSATPDQPVGTLAYPNPTAQNQFGFAVALAGTKVVVGAPQRSSSPAGSGRAYTYDLAGATPGVPEFTLTNPASALRDYFGSAVAIWGTQVVVGAPLDDSRARDAGSAYLYNLATPNPTDPAAALNVPAPAMEDYFGYALAVSDTRLVVSAPYDDTRTNDAGVVYVYDLANPTLPALTLTNPQPGQGDLFGFSVAIDGSLLAVGTPEADDLPFNPGSGRAYVYDLASGTPTSPVLTVNNPVPNLSDNFGRSVALSGTRLAISSYWDDNRIFAGGSAYIYELAGPTPAVPAYYLNHSPTQSIQSYFSTVAISGSRAIIGAPESDFGALSAGGVSIYELSTNGYIRPVLVITNPSPSYSDNFGNSVAISGHTLVVGAILDDTGASDAGSAYVYNLASATPGVPVLTLTNPNPVTSDFFGWSVALSGSRVVISAFGSDSGATNAGLVYVFDLNSPTPAVPVATLPNPSPAQDDYFGGAVAIVGSVIVAGAYLDDTHAFGRGAAYIFGLRPALNVDLAAPAVATLSWAPTDSPGFVLQYKDTLEATNWLNAPSGALNPVTIPTTNAARFYRVAQP